MMMHEQFGNPMEGGFGGMGMGMGGGMGMNWNNRDEDDYEQFM